MLFRLWARRSEVPVADLAGHDVGVLAVGAASAREPFVVSRYLLGYGISSWQFLYWYVSCCEFDRGASGANVGDEKALRSPYPPCQCL